MAPDKWFEHIKGGAVSKGISKKSVDYLFAEGSWHDQPPPPSPPNSDTVGVAEAMTDGKVCQISAFAFPWSGGEIMDSVQSRLVIQAWNETGCKLTDPQQFHFGAVYRTTGDDQAMTYAEWYKSLTDECRKSCYHAEGKVHRFAGKTKLPAAFPGPKVVVKDAQLPAVADSEVRGADAGAVTSEC